MHDWPLMPIVPFIFGGPLLYTNSLEVFQQVLQAESKIELVKPLELTAALMSVTSSVFHCSFKLLFLIGSGAKMSCP
jgi:hypothetical protein